MKIFKLVASLAISFSAAFIGSLATTSNIPNWYVLLDKPYLNPPNWVFGPVWTILYTLIGISLYLVWTSKKQGKKVRAYIAFGAQLTLNTLWSLVFFGIHQTWLGIAIILLLLVSIMLTIYYFRAYSRSTTYLLLPYLFWVTFATYLNIGIALAN